MSQERVVVCAWTRARQPIETDIDLPNGWLEITSIRIGDGTEQGEELEDLHFANFTALAKWAESRALTSKMSFQTRKPERVWQSERQ